MVGVPNCTPGIMSDDPGRTELIPLGPHPPRSAAMHNERTRSTHLSRSPTTATGYREK